MNNSKGRPTSTQGKSPGRSTTRRPAAGCNSTGTLLQLRNDTPRFVDTSNCVAEMRMLVECWAMLRAASAFVRVQRFECWPGGGWNMIDYPPAADRVPLGHSAQVCPHVFIGIMKMKTYQQMRKSSILGKPHHVCSPLINPACPRSSLLLVCRSHDHVVPRLITVP